MTIDAALGSGKSARNAHDHATVYISGAVEPDHDPSHFRVYINPQNRRSYLLLKKTDVAGELYEWTAEETVHASFKGNKIFNIPLCTGTQIQRVSVKIFRAGEKGSPNKALDRVCCCDDEAGCQGSTCGFTDSSTCSTIGTQSPSSACS